MEKRIDDQKEMRARGIRRVGSGEQAEPCGDRRGFEERVQVCFCSRLVVMQLGEERARVYMFVFMQGGEKEGERERGPVFMLRVISWPEQMGFICQETGACSTKASFHR